MCFLNYGRLCYAGALLLISGCAFADNQLLKKDALKIQAGGGIVKAFATKPKIIDINPVSPARTQLPKGSTFSVGSGVHDPSLSHEHEKIFALCPDERRCNYIKGDTPPDFQKYKFLMNFEGFAEVAFVLNIQPATNAIDRRRCSAVFIGQKHALLARHCIEGDDTESWTAKYVLLTGRRVSAASSPTPDLGKCLNEGDLSECEYLRSKILKVRFTSSYDSIPLSNQSRSLTVNAPDIALLTLEAPSQTRKVAQIQPTTRFTANQNEPENWLTIMGFGRTDIKNQPYGILSGGYWMSPDPPRILYSRDEKPQMAVLIHSDKLPVTRICGHDSGAPVFIGRYLGTESAPRLVGGLVSIGFGYIESSQTCPKSPGAAVQLITPEIAAWIQTSIQADNQK